MSVRSPFCWRQQNGRSDVSPMPLGHIGTRAGCAAPNVSPGEGGLIKTPSRDVGRQPRWKTYTPGYFRGAGKVLRIRRGSDLEIAPLRPPRKADQR